MSIPTCSSTSGACSSIVSSSAMSLSRSCSSIFLSSETSRRLRGLPRNGAFAILFTGADRATLEPVLRTVACSDRSRGRRREGDFVRDFIVFGAMHDPPEPCRCTLAWVRHNAVHTYVCRAAVGSVSDDPPIGKPRTNLIAYASFRPTSASLIRFGSGQARTKPDLPYRSGQTPSAPIRFVRGNEVEVRLSAGRCGLRHACSEAYGRASEDKVRIQKRDAEIMRLQDIRELGASEHERLGALYQQLVGDLHQGPSHVRTHLSCLYSIDGAIDDPLPCRIRTDDLDAHPPAGAMVQTGRHRGLGGEDT